MDEMALPGLPLSSHHGVDTTRILIFILVVALLALFGAILAVIMETSLIWAAVSYTGIGFVIAIWFRPYWGLLFLLFVIPLQYLANITGDGSITLA
ncbi:MAG: hypothetical protein SV775_14115, partial [Thermodesulfobacteriota bacterium]|nr:hypothetical protein [Thermodesulfobacteriota bacterium]